MVIYLGSLVQLCCGEGLTLQINITGMCGECLQCPSHTGFAPAHGTCTFPLYTSQALGCSAGEPSELGPGLHAFPRSTPFRFLGTPQRHGFSWACVSCSRFVPFPGPSSSGNQVLGESTLTRCRASYPLPGPSRLLSLVRSCISGVPCVSSGELISGCDPPDGCQLSNIPGRLG